MNKKKLKKFWNKFKLPIIVVVLLAIFVTISTLIGDKVEKDEVDVWLDETKKSQYVLTLISQTNCSHCLEFKPVLNEVVQEYGDKFMYKTFEIDTIVNTAVRNKLIYSYDIDFEGTPHLFVTYDGKLLGEFDEINRTKENLIKFLQDKGVIEQFKHLSFVFEEVL